MKTTSYIGLLLMIIAMAALWKVHALFVQVPAVMVVQGLALALLMWARLTFGLRSLHAAANPTAGGLVTSGPYRFIRHPIYTAACMIGWAGIAGHPSTIAVAAGLLLMVGTYMRIIAEERLVTERYPEYAEYAKRTRRMVPLLF